MTIAFDKLGEIFAPLESLLASGGDTRLRLDPVTRLNGYGCRPYPRPEAFTFASSTATSISPRAFAAAEAVRHDLIRAGLRRGLEPAFDAIVEAQRHELKRLLGLGDTATDVVFSPSGTDGELQAVFVARSLLGTPLTSVVVASDETGSGVGYAACGRHFSSLTAQGAAVEKGRPILGLAENLSVVPVPLRDAEGRERDLAEIDAAVVDAVAAAMASGGRALLHAMDHSKLGRRGPSLDCLRRVGARWGERVLIVVDACQLRLGRARLGWHLDQGHLVLITGSKFFTGPPFSGALLVPARLASRLAEDGGVPPGLADYASRSDWPAAWRGVRATLRERMNLGQLLRWTAALEEMRAYFAVPEAFRRSALGQFATVVPALIAERGTLSLLPEQAPAAAGEFADDEMAARTIFPFLPHRAGAPLALAEARLLYRALNEDVAALLPGSAGAEDRRLAASLCHIGQPVAIADGDGVVAAALRISAGARYVSESWVTGDEAASRRNLAGEFAQIRVILDKIELLLRHFDAVVSAAEVSPSTEPFSCIAGEGSEHSEPDEGLARKRRNKASLGLAGRRF
jgi:hypothetical protein